MVDILDLISLINASDYHYNSDFPIFEMRIIIWKVNCNGH